MESNILMKEKGWQKGDSFKIETEELLKILNILEDNINYSNIIIILNKDTNTKKITLNKIIPITNNSNIDSELCDGMVSIIDAIDEINLALDIRNNLKIECET